MEMLLPEEEGVGTRLVITGEGELETHRLAVLQKQEAAAASGAVGRGPQGRWKVWSDSKGKEP